MNMILYMILNETSNKNDIKNNNSVQTTADPSVLKPVVISSLCDIKPSMGDPVNKQTGPSAVSQPVSNGGLGFQGDGPKQQMSRRHACVKRASA